jgi:hypothetical protein
MRKFSSLCLLLCLAGGATLNAGRALANPASAKTLTLATADTMGVALTRETGAGKARSAVLSEIDPSAFVLAGYPLIMFATLHVGWSLEAGSPASTRTGS